MIADGGRFFFRRQVGKAVGVVVAVAFAVFDAEHSQGREILLQYVPIFVAVLVWLTRILFIGAVAMAGERLFERTGQPVAAPQRARPAPKRPVAPGPNPISVPTRLSATSLPMRMNWNATSLSWQPVVCPNGKRWKSGWKLVMSYLSTV